ncbi:MAG TPA: FAD-binding oxidoreductase [Vicinamibacterales bacterium]|nr:FAD-binding oxidoreductase [Vicinamibacterales bacterium]
MIAIETFTAQVGDVDNLTHDVRAIRLELIRPPQIEFQAGQFVSFEVPKPGLPFPVTRPYSIASPPSNRHAIDLLLNLVPGGPGSTFLFSLQSGDPVSFRGPAGTFVLREYPDRRLLFVATGTGLAPMRSMLHARLPSPTPVTLIWGLRHEHDIYYQDELADLAEKFPEFSYMITLSQPSPSWTGAVGRVQSHIEPHIATVDDLAVYVCGSKAMITSVTEQIRSRGTCPIHREQYF